MNSTIRAYEPVVSVCFEKEREARKKSLATHTHEDKDAPSQSYHERNALCGPFAAVYKDGKYLRWIPVISKDRQRNENGKETQDMKHKYQAFEFREKRTAYSIDEYGERYNCPDEQGRLIALSLVFRKRKYG